MIVDAQGDAAVLLAIKEAEANALRQQMVQLSEDLRRNATVGCWTTLVQREVAATGPSLDRISADSQLDR